MVQTPSSVDVLQTEHLDSLDDFASHTLCVVLDKVTGGINIEDLQDQLLPSTIVKRG